MPKSFLPKNPRPLSVDEMKELERSDFRNAARRAEADQNDLAAVQEAWEQMEAWLAFGTPDGLPTNWGAKLLSKVDNNIRKFWEVCFPGLIEGITFEAARAIQGVGTGSVQKFPPALYIGNSGCYLMFHYDENAGHWSVKIENADTELRLRLVFLIESREIGYVVLDSKDFDFTKIPDETHEQADRMLILED